MLRLAALLSFMMSSSVFAQFGGGFEFTGNPTLETENIVVAIAKSKKAVHAFSSETGVWSTVRVSPSQGEEITPILGNNVAVFVLGTKAYAFGGTSGQWAFAELSEPGIPTISRNRARIDDGSRILLFSSTSRQWAIMDLDAKWDTDDLEAN